MNLVQRKLETHIGEYTARIAAEKTKSKPHTHTHKHTGITSFYFQ